MSSFKQQLLTLNLLSEGMTDELSECKETDVLASPLYVDLLKQYLETSKSLSVLASSYTDMEFKSAIQNRGICLHLMNKKMLMIQNKLVNYLIDYFEATFRLNEIRDADFSENANIRFDLLSVRAIKSKSQFKTVADALTDSEYQILQSEIGLPELNWRD